MDELVALCAECGIEDTLDPKMKICFECWCVLDLKNHDQQKLEEE